MKYAQIKQYLGNNLWYGENGKDRLFFADFGGNYITVQSVTMPDGSKVWIIDISHWNAPPVDLKRMKEMFGLSGVIIKGCDGSLNTRYYPEHVAAAKLADIPWGMYVWLYRAANVSIDAQTTTWTNRAKADPPPMGVWIDAEWTYYGGNPSNPTATDLRSAHNSFKTKYGKPAGTYTAPGYANQYLVGFDFTKEENWVAEWGVSTPVIWKHPYTLHQFTSQLDGSVLDPNGNKGIDGSYFNGTKEQFNAKYGVATTPPPTGETVDAVINNKASWSNMRSGPGVNYADLGDLLPATVIQYTTVQNNYVRVVSAKLNGADVLTTSGKRMDEVEVWTYKNNVTDTPPVEPPPSGERIASIFKTEEIVVKYDNGDTETFRAENIEFTKVE